MIRCYCDSRINSDGTTGCYVLESGEYTLTIRRDARSILDRRIFTVQKTIWFADGNVRLSDIGAQESSLEGMHRNTVSASVAAVNRFDVLRRYTRVPGNSGMRLLTRSDWANTQPTAPDEEDRLARDWVVQAIADADTTSFDWRTDPVPGSVPGSLVFTETAYETGAERQLVLADLRGKRYDDPTWDALLNQLSFDRPADYQQTLFEAGYQTASLETIGQPASVEYDGPQGLTLADVNGKNWLRNVCGYPAAPVQAATWRKALIVMNVFALFLVAIIILLGFRRSKQ